MDIVELVKLTPESCFIQSYDVSKKGRHKILYKPESCFGLIVGGCLVVINQNERVSFLGLTKDFILHDYLLCPYANYQLEILEPTTILWFKFGWQDFFDKCLQEQIRKICEQSIIFHWGNTSKILKILQEPCAENRVLYFINDFPANFYKIPYKYLASFLAITPETFSRIVNKKRKN